MTLFEEPIVASNRYTAMHENLSILKFLHCSTTMGWWTKTSPEDSGRNYVMLRW